MRVELYKELIKRVSTLLTVKTIVTLSITWTICGIIRTGLSKIQLSDSVVEMMIQRFFDVFLTVIGFYFGTQAEKAGKD